MLWKCYTQYASKFGKLSSGHRTGESVFTLIPQKGSAKECWEYHTIALISHASKVMLKILQAMLQQYMNHTLPEVQAGSRKGRGTRGQIFTICWIIEKARELQKNINFCFINFAKAFDYFSSVHFSSVTQSCTTLCDLNKLWKILQRWEYQTIWSDSWEISMQVMKQLLELDMEQQTGSKPGKEYVKAVYCHPVI